MKYSYISNKIDPEDIRFYKTISLDDVEEVLLEDRIKLIKANYQQYLRLIIDKIESKEKNFIFWMNSKLYKILKKDKEIEQGLLKNHSLIFPNGRYIRYGIKLLSKKEFIPIDKLRLIYDILYIGSFEKWNFFFLGGSPYTLEKLFFNIRKTIPNLRLVGKHHENFDEKRAYEILEGIKKLKPDVVIIGLKYIKQELWGLKNHKYFENTTVVFAERCFDYMLEDKDYPKNEDPFFSGTLFIIKSLFSK